MDFSMQSIINLFDRIWQAIQQIFQNFLASNPDIAQFGIGGLVIVAILLVLVSEL